MGFISEIIAFILGFFAKILLLDIWGEQILTRLRQMAIQRARLRYTRIDTPSPFSKFRCYRIGNLEIPAMVVVGSPKTPFSFDEVTIDYKPILREELPDFPNDLKAAWSYLIDQSKRKYDIKRFQDNILPRIDSAAEQEFENEGDQRGGLKVSFSLTRFSSMLATNCALDYKVLPQRGLIAGLLTNRTLREAYTSPPYDDLARSILSNAASVEVILVSRNPSQTPPDQVIIRQRSPQVVNFTGFYQSSAAGYISLSHCSKDNIPNPFIGAVEEAKQEIADRLTVVPQDFKLIGIALAWQTLFPAFFGYIETGQSVAELLGDFKRDSYEGYLDAIPFDPTSVLSHIAEENWTPMSALAMIATLRVFYPDSDIDSISRKLPMKTWQKFLLPEQLSTPDSCSVS